MVCHQNKMVAGNGWRFRCVIKIATIKLSENLQCVDNLKKEKQVMKMQLTKIYTRLVRLMLGDEPAWEEILQSLEDFESKKFEVLGVIEALIGIYRGIGDEKSAVKAEDELDNVTSDLNKDVGSVKGFVLTTFAKPSLSKTKEPDVVERRKSSWVCNCEIHAYVKTVTRPPPFFTLFLYIHIFIYV